MVRYCFSPSIYENYLFSLPLTQSHSKVNADGPLCSDFESHGAFPDNFFGRHYVEFLSELSQKRNVKRYIEIGVESGYLLSRIHAENAIAVDPHFKISHNVVEHKSSVTLRKMTSDVFFSDEANYKPLGGPPDLVFLDGFHTFEYLLRDVFNAESICGRNGLIFLHDCLPLNAEMAERSQSLSAKKNATSKFPGFWTGDVWKITLILQKYRPDLRLLFLDCPPTGLVAVTQLDSRSTVLKENYLNIVAEFRDIPNSIDDIGKMYASIKVTPSELVLKEFDNTLYCLT